MARVCEGDRDGRSFEAKKRPELGLFIVAGERKRQPGFLSVGSFEIELFDFDTCAQGEHDDNHQRGCHVCQK